MSPEETQRQIADLRDLRAQLTRWSVGIPVVAILIVLTGLWLITDAARGLVNEGPRREEFVTALTGGLKQDVVPMVESIARRTYTDTRAGLEREFERLNSRAPEISQALGSEVEKLLNNLPKRGESALKATFGEMIKKREADIRKMFPDATEQNVSTFVSNLMGEAEEQAHNLTAKLFGPQLIELDGILANIDRIRASEKLGPTEDLATWDTALLVVDLLRDEFKELHVQEVDATPAARGQKGGAK